MPLEEVAAAEVMEGVVHHHQGVTVRAGPVAPGPPDLPVPHQAAEEGSISVRDLLVKNIG